MTAVLGSSARHLSMEPTTAATAPMSVDDAWVRRIVHVNDIFSPSSPEERELYSRVLHRPTGTESFSSAFSVVSTATVSLVESSVYGLLARRYSAAASTAPIVTDVGIGHEQALPSEDGIVALRKEQRKRDRRAAVMAGILSGLGIRPRRPRNPIDRMDAALRRVSQTELIDASY